MMKNFYVDTTKGLDVLNVVHEIRGVVRETKMQDGNVTIVVPDPGAAVVAMEKEAKIEELKNGLEPLRASGVLRCLLPRSLVMTVEKGKMSIEPWQEIFLIDYETAGRRREFRVQIQGEPAPGGTAGKEKAK